MQLFWLHKKDRDRLIVFCNGWGMDRFPFQSLGSSAYDVCMLCDYRDLTGAPDLVRLAKQYRQVVLIGWSMGVWVGQKLFAKTKHLLHRTVAINGTLCPIDDGLGIPVEVFTATLAHFDADARLKFYKRMCREKQNLRLFLARQPQRPLAEQAAELAALQHMVDCRPAAQSLYQEVIVADQDYIVPTANQLRFWQNRQVSVVAGFHFLFNLWSSWEQLLACSAAAVVAPQENLSG